MTRGLAAFLLLVVALLGCLARDTRCEDGASGAPAACVACKGTRTAACPTCAGKGRTPVACAVCAGKGRLACPRRASDATAPGSHTGTEIDCPNKLCSKGTIRWTDGKSSTCKLCGGAGKARCMECQLASSPCGACSGKGTVDSHCDDCAGRGHLACVLCADRSAKCAECDGRQKLPCPACRATGVLAQACLDCAARGVVACKTCDGLGKTACPDCDATGRYRAEFEDHTAAASTHCRSCDGRGTQTCGNCTAGRARCGACGGAKTSKEPCPACAGRSKVECRSCGDWMPRAAELQADRLTKPAATPEETRAAIAMLEPAFARAKAAADSAKAEVERLDKATPDQTAQARLAARTARSEASQRASWFEGIAERCSVMLERIRPPGPKVK